MEGAPGGRRMEANGLSFHVEDHGEGSPVLLLHGWPDSSYLWRHQIPALAAAGHRVIAPDLRGFGRSDRPSEATAYAMTTLVADVAGILDAAGVERATVVGHDWGASLAWVVAGFLPERVERLVVLSVGHPTAFARVGMRQWQRSWYMLWFQFEGVAEAALPRNDWQLFRDFVGSGGGDVDRYIADLSRPGALTASLNWYRANISPAMFGGEPPRLPPARCPTMGIWSSGDFALTEEQMQLSAEHVDASWRLERIDGCGHWIPVQAPDVLNRLLLDFIPTPAGV
ncbi:MAG: alpha/beta hydrolase [Chloroflexi bacterium]|nr:MAG: alpha/beta hydrolase [Chloroflexota bacterium]